MAAQGQVGPFLPFLPEGVRRWVQDQQQKCQDMANRAQEITNQTLGRFSLEFGGGLGAVALGAARVFSPVVSTGLIMLGGYSLFNRVVQLIPAVEEAAQPLREARDQVREKGYCSRDCGSKVSKLFGKACAWGWKLYYPNSTFPVEEYAPKMAGAALTFAGTLLTKLPSAITAGAVYVGIDAYNAESVKSYLTQNSLKVVAGLGTSFFASQVPFLGLKTVLNLGLIAYIATDILNAKAPEARRDRAPQHVLMTQELNQPLEIGEGMARERKRCCTLKEALEESQKRGKISLERCNSENPTDGDRKYLRAIFQKALAKNWDIFAKKPDGTPYLRNTIEEIVDAWTSGLPHLYVRAMTDALLSFNGQEFHAGPGRRYRDGAGGFGGGFPGGGPRGFHDWFPGAFPRQGANFR